MPAARIMLGLIYIAEGLTALATFGAYVPNWSLRYALWIARRR